jgi:hypothetical protein
MLKAFYFTYGSEGYDFEGGWTLIYAQDLDAAIGAFRIYHPNRSGNECLMCASFYSEAEFKKTNMYNKGNLGARCHEVITLKRALPDDKCEDSNQIDTDRPYSVHRGINIFFDGNEYYILGRDTIKSDNIDDICICIDEMLDY